MKKAKATRAVPDTFLNNEHLETKVTRAQMLAANILTVSAIFGAGGNIVAGDPLAIPKALPEIAAHVINYCTPTPDEHFQPMRDKLANLRAHPEKVTVNVLDLEGRRALAEKYGLTISPEAGKTIDEIAKNKKDPHKAVALLNELTSSEYGFKTTAHYQDPTQVSKDAARTAYVLRDIPTEIVRAAQVDKLTLDTPPVLGGLRPNAAGITLRGIDTIRLEAGHPEMFTHEWAHKENAQSAAHYCLFSTIEEDPNYAAANPPHFQYGESSASRKIVPTAYAGRGGVEEDYADMWKKVLDAPNNPSDCLYGRSPVIDEKIAVLLTRMEDEVPGAGGYLAEVLIGANDRGLCDIK
jgi:hypothetical protein